MLTISDEINDAINRLRSMFDEEGYRDLKQEDLNAIRWALSLALEHCSTGTMLQLKNEIAQLKSLLIDDGYKEYSLVFSKLLHIEQLRAYIEQEKLSSTKNDYEKSPPVCPDWLKNGTCANTEYVCTGCEK